MPFTDIFIWNWTRAGWLAAIVLLVTTASIIPIRKVVPERVIVAVDQPFAGLDASLRAGKTTHLLIVHGMEIHCIGYAQQLVDGIISNLSVPLSAMPSGPHTAEKFTEKECLTGFKNGTYFINSNPNNPQTSGRPTTEVELCWQLSKHDSCELIEISGPTTGGGRGPARAYGYS